MYSKLILEKNKLWDNNYLSSRGGTSFCVRCCCLTDGKGVGARHVPVVIIGGKTLQIQIINERNSRRLKYDKPKMEKLKRQSVPNR